MAARQTLAQQLKELHENAAPTTEIDPEAAYSSLSTFKPSKDKEFTDSARGHYAAVGQSKLRDTAASTFADLDQKYNSASKSQGTRTKIFDDDPSDEEDEQENDGNGRAEARGEYDYMGESSGGEESFASEDDEDEEDEEDDLEDEEDADMERDDDDEENDQLSFKPNIPSLLGQRSVKPPPPPPSTTPLDPVAALKSSKSKDVAKGLAIKKQQKVFDELLTSRITFQKAWSAGQKLQVPVGEKRKFDALEDDDVRAKVTSCLESLGDLNQRLFSLRSAITLAPTSSKRPQVDSDNYEETAYWQTSTRQSHELMSQCHSSLVHTLQKWSSKIQAAAAQQTGSANLGAKFSTNEPVDIVDAINQGIASKDRSGNFWQDEEPAYKSLLREVIESRSGTAAAGINQMQSEKKKKRDAERGASKGRKLRYTVHEKAASFVVPVPLSHGWHEEQIDELFSNLLGGPSGSNEAGEVTVAGADRDDGVILGAASGAVDEQAGNPLSSLRVF